MGRMTSLGSCVGGAARGGAAGLGVGGVASTSLEASSDLPDDDK
jgi:hypothetical protein